MIGFSITFVKFFSWILFFARGITVRFLKKYKKIIENSPYIITVDLKTSENEGLQDTIKTARYHKGVVNWTPLVNKTLNSDQFYRV